MLKPPKIIIDAFYVKNIHFFVMLFCVLMQMLSIGWAYRFFAYANLVIVLIDAFRQYKISRSFKDFQWLKYPIYFALGFITLHFIAVQNLIIIKEIRHILLAIFLIIGVVTFANKKNEYVRKNTFIFTILIIIIYVILQSIFLWVFNKPFGTAKNPHYLALFSSVCMITAIYCFFNTSIKLKCLLGICILLLGAFLIESSSRPAFLALILSGLLLTYFLKRKSKFYAVLTATLTLLSLGLTNLGGFAERIIDLIANISTEERIVIWQETWKMQEDSSLSEWVVGHGISTFEEAFKPYSSYHLINIDFNSPHNYLLELLYTSGLLGLFLVFFMFWLIYKKLICSIMSEDKHKFIYMTLMTVLTSTVICSSLILPFFYSYTLNIIALVMGTMFYLNKVGNS